MPVTPTPTTPAAAARPAATRRPPSSDRDDARTLAALAAEARAFTGEVATVHRRWFAPRGRFDPVDELAYEHDWRQLVQRAARLPERLERGRDPARRRFAPRRDPALERFEAQLEHARAWSAALRLTTRFAAARALLEAVLPHDAPPARPHAALCCCAATLEALAAARPRPERTTP